MSKQSKKRPKPVPCEAWAVTFYDGEIHPGFVTATRRAARLRRVRVGDPGEIIRVRIVPVIAKAKNQKEEPMVTKKNPELDTVRRWWGIYCLSTNRLVATHLHDSKRSAGSQVQG